MGAILIIDDLAIVREPIAAALRSAGHQVVTASNGKEALAAVAASPPHLILLDLAMPVMSGQVFLQKLRLNPAFQNIPVILLTATSTKEHILEAAKYGVRGCILKTRFSLQDLLDRIAKLMPDPPDVPQAHHSPLAADSAPKSAQPESAMPSQPKAPDASSAAPPVSAWPRLLKRQETLQHLEKIAEGKTIAGVVSHVIALAASPTSNVADLVNIINTDPILATRVLQLANSAAFACNKARISTVEEATRNIGLRGIQNMATAVGIFTAFPADDDAGSHSMRAWQHSFAVAEIMAMLVRDEEPQSESLNHLTGLCHDLGGALLRQHFIAEYQQITEFAAAHNLPLTAVESIALGIPHAELTSQLLTRIGLPVPVVQAIKEFDDACAKPNFSPQGPAALRLRIANRLANGMLLTPGLEGLIGPILRAHWQKIASKKLPPAIDPLQQRGAILATTNLLARLPVKEEQRLSQPLIAKRPLKILYLRADSYINLDPLALALSLTCDLAILDTLPAPHDLPAADGIIHVSQRPAPRTVDALQNLYRAAGLPDAPVLQLTAQSESSPTSDATAVRHYPLTLAALDRWLDSVADHLATSAAIANQSLA